ncbi:L-type lectin-domain containing receptor kinase IX.1-like [Corylus avellana]|uniref:L-type lectin-domain containing receptor kinase IX.1-like n=1 Tax=Corylus avellana TaxID=13451 RepID=UPI00286C0C8B|nr:L-type lectin-domain containing receptor kinase IX.1-like [Corylus avellana]
MAFYMFKIKHFPFPKPLILFYLLIITGFFSEPSPFTSALNFRFPNFTSGDTRIKYERAFPKDQVIQLTGNKAITNVVGRATYSSPMHLWDKASRNLTDFSTNFTFVIDSQEKSNYGDGLAFFLAPNGSIIPPDVDEGGAMVLTNDHEPLNSTDNPFVAVEFDIFSNIDPVTKLWDPPGEHVAATGGSSAIYTVHTWDFSSSLKDVVTNQRKKNNLGLAIGLGVGGPFLVGGLALILLGLWKKKNRRRTDEELALDRCMDEEFQKGIGPKRFLFNELARATNNFNDEEKLGQGGFGGVYKGFLRDSNTFVAVKRVSKGSKQGIKEYASEVKIISRLRHKNLVQLIGWCHERGELLLVYEFMPNGSLDSHLFREENLLIWAMRYNIAQGLALALLYLHEEWEQCVVHRDIKSSNIMLDSNFNTKLGDFGLARLVDHLKGSQTTVLAGTMGYMAPECVTTGKASKESDVYSFGIVALEIACGRKPIKLNAPENQVVMVEWVWELYGIGKILEAVDPKLGGDFDEQQMERLMIVGLWCAHPDRNLRPSIRQTIHVLNFEAPLPVLPSNIPGPPQFSATMNRHAMSLSMPHVAAHHEGGHNQYTSNSYTNSSVSTSSSTASPSASLLHTS